MSLPSPIRIFLVVTLGVLGVWLASCHSVPPVPPSRSPLAGIEGVLRAGVAREEITPTPGLSMFGHGPEGRITVGFRTRLYCEAFVFLRTDNGKTEAVAFVPCDLAAPSLELQREIAKRLDKRGVKIGAERIFLSATHTHAGPAHYFGPRSYSGNFSSYAPGFDPAVLDFLAEKIQSAIAKAYLEAKPACVGWGTDNVFGLTVNRSFVPYSANKHVPDELLDVRDRVRAFKESKFDAGADAAETAAAQTAADPTTPDECDAGAKVKKPPTPFTYAEAAVDPQLSVLRVDRRRDDDEAGTCKGSKPMGVLAVFGMHNTGFPNTNDLFHGDIFGFASRVVSACMNQRIRQPNPDPQNPNSNGLACDDDKAWPKDGDPSFVTGIANGIEGDVSPATDFQGGREARRLGRSLGYKILKVFEDLEPRLTTDAPLRVAYHELRLPNALADDSNKAERLCAAPAFGAPAAGGARDGVTRFTIIPEMNPGQRLEKAYGCQAEKLPLNLLLKRASDDGLDYPAIVPIGMMQIGNGYIATAPAELTTVTGLRARDAVWKNLGKPSSPIAIVGLTNSYLQYVATDEEYRYQHYEGASTLYGPYSSRFFVYRMGCLAKALVDKNAFASCKLDQPFAIDTLNPVDWAPSPVVSRMAPDEDGKQVVLKDVVAQQTHDAGLLGWLIRWKGTPKAALKTRAQLAVSIVDVDKNEVMEDDRGSSFEIRLDDDTWTARWLPDLREKGRDERCGKSVRFVVSGRVSAASKPFVIECPVDTRAGRR